jgi:hypothetical protein
MMLCVNDVQYLELEWQESSQFRGKFRVFPELGPFKVSFPIIEMGRKLRVSPGIQMTQFTDVINHATTGHKHNGQKSRTGLTLFSQ